jgi:hypothetical protein
LVGFAAAGCRDPTGLTGAAAVALSGTYGATFTVSLANGSETRQASEPGTITLLAQGANGTFGGSYLLKDGSSGVLDGLVAADGGIILTAFGRPNEVTLANLRYVQTLFPYCDWPDATASDAFSGSVRGVTLTLTASAFLLCTYSPPSGPVAIPTVVALSISGTRG